MVKTRNSERGGSARRQPLMIHGTTRHQMISLLTPAARQSIPCEKQARPEKPGFLLALNPFLGRLGLGWREQL
jgi:hypothetical protein